MNLNPGLGNQITILDPMMKKYGIRLVKSPNEILGFNLKNETGEHLYIEIKWKSGPGELEIDELIIRK